MALSRDLLKSDDTEDAAPRPQAAAPPTPAAATLTGKAGAEVKSKARRTAMAVGLAT